LLPGFFARYPALRVSIDLDDRRVDILGSGSDLALRIGPLEDSTLVARRICDYRRVVCAAPEYLQKAGEPSTPADLVGHTCLHYSNLALREEWAFSTGDGKIETVEVKGPLCANNGDLLRKVAVSGMGICSLPEFIVAEDLAAGRLNAILTGFEAPTLTLWALWPSRRYVPAKVRVFVDYLVGHLATTDRDGSREQAPDPVPGGGSSKSARVARRAESGHL
jgi:DNA-binding transcriptional LysR family regulator